MMLLSHSVKKNEAGCSEREKEAATYMLFLDLLHDCEEQVHEGNKT